MRVLCKMYTGFRSMFLLFVVYFTGCVTCENTKYVSICVCPAGHTEDLTKCLMRIRILRCRCMSFLFAVCFIGFMLCETVKTIST